MNYHSLKELMEKRFSESEKTRSRYLHSLEVVKMALTLNETLKLNLDVEKVRISALLHDYAKVLPITEQKRLLHKYLAKRDALYYEKYDSVIHSIIGAYLVKEELKIDDAEIFDAIYYHTTGKKKMPLLTKLIYLSDAIEATRNYDGVEDLRRSALKDIDLGVFEVLKHTVTYLKDSSKDIEKNTLEAYLYYKEVMNEVS